LSFGDIAIDNAKSSKVVSLNIKRSKTNQGAVGICVILGRTEDDLCPVSALLEYPSKIGKGTLFQWENQIPLSKTKATCQDLSAANLPAKDYAGHSFRIGAATRTATAGLEDSTIQILGRWKSSSYQLYIRTSPQYIASSIVASHIKVCHLAMNTDASPCICMYVCRYVCLR